MRIISWNVNGIRAVERKGELKNCLKKYDPDVFLVQEIKAQAEQLKKLDAQYPEYDKHYHSAEKPGYAGTAIWVKRQKCPQQTFATGMPDFNDDEGRISQVDLGDYSILGVYFPNGGKSPEAWEGKLVFYEKFLDYVNTLRAKGQKVIWAGDVNCAHEEIDIARPEENDGKIGFHPRERAWVTQCVQNNWSDVWRQTFPDKKDVYSWWHVITRARDRNVGWRIDYFFVDQSLFPSVKKIEYLNDQMGSDHCPVLLDL